MYENTLVEINIHGDKKELTEKLNNLQMKYLLHLCSPLIIVKVRELLFYIPSVGE